MNPTFFVILDAADNMAIGAKLYYHAKVGSFRDSIRVSVFVYGQNGKKLMDK